VSLACDGCGELDGLEMCQACEAVLCSFCFGAFRDVCQACLADDEDRPRLGPVVEDVRVNRAVL
jgi:hypothetical protein